MTKYWVDPPSGWKFGFPKIYDMDADGPLADWVAANGYTGSFEYVRMWEARDDDETVVARRVDGSTTG